VPIEQTPIPSPFIPSDPPLIRKGGDREPAQDPPVGSGVTPVVNGTPRGGGGKNP
jgi:hypothetical protein